MLEYMVYVCMILIYTMRERQRQRMKKRERQTKRYTETEREEKRETRVHIATHISLGDGPRDHGREHPCEGADGIRDPQQRPGEVGRDVLVRAEEAAVGTPAEAHGEAQHHHRKHGVAVHEAHDHQAYHSAVESCWTGGQAKNFRFFLQDTTNFLMSTITNRFKITIICITTISTAKYDLKHKKSPPSSRQQR